MVFSSSTFLFVFFPIVLVGYYLLHQRYRNIFLLLTSLGFYAFGEPQFVFIMLISIIINYLNALAIDKCKTKKRKKTWLVIGIILNLSLLVIFKYMNFISMNLKRFFQSITETSLALPIGISFFTFQAMSYIIDVYRGEKVQKNPFNLGLYISFFPQLVAGPIVRYKTIAYEIDNRKESWTDFSNGVVLFVNGLVKKIIFANNMAIIADKAFTGDVIQHSILFSWFGALAYALQIYFDFSGYSDMALGLGKMFGFHFDKNFDYPYAAKSITDFWRRWHISLGSWFRDYVYIPLGGSRGGKRDCIRNLFIVWLITGVWHGANWTFVFWGIAYFVVIIFEKYVIKPERFEKSLLSWPYRIFILLTVMFCWVIFRASSVTVAACYIKSMFGLYKNPLIDDNWLWYSREYLFLLCCAILLSTPLVRMIIGFIKKKFNPIIYNMGRVVMYIFLFLVSVSYLVLGAHNPFIYFNF
ncbi:MAG: MBOAT family O-acyltransferase [Christensenellales bacterium]|jgi:alginate O-acetyltransferase complex protein AlgI